ncbi:hypothetical protein BDW68DRAFT_71466 [Aspergillus falconensis]
MFSFSFFFSWLCPSEPPVKVVYMIGGRAIWWPSNQGTIRLFPTEDGQTPCMVLVERKVMGIAAKKLGATDNEFQTSCDRLLFLN